LELKQLMICISAGQPNYFGTVFYEINVKVKQGLQAV